MLKQTCYNENESLGALWTSKGNGKVTRWILCQRVRKLKYSLCNTLSLWKRGTTVVQLMLTGGKKMGRVFFQNEDEFICGLKNLVKEWW